MKTQTKLTTTWLRVRREVLTLGLLGAGLVIQPLWALSHEGSEATSVNRAGSIKYREEVQVIDFKPFTHFASVPANADPATIRFEKVKAVKVMTEVKTTTEAGDCRELSFREPGGSMYCPSTTYQAPEPAYRVTYSYQGEPLPSDEYGGRDFTFQVVFHPEELSPELRESIAHKKIKRAELATYFQLAIYRLPVPVTVVDEASSRFCEGNYVEGLWQHSDPQCRDQIHYKTISRPSEYLTVRVDPVSSQRKAAMAQPALGLSLTGRARGQ